MMDANELVAEARRRTGLTDFGDAPFRDGLEVLVDAIGREAGLNEAGVAAAVEEFVGILAIRLRIEEACRRDPVVDEQRIVSPIFVTGLPRSGTTATSQMLSQDPANRSIRRWEAAMPVPPPHPATAATDERFVTMQRKLDERYALTPRLMAMNPITAGDPTESLCFLRMTFRAPHFGGFYHVPTYMDWLAGQDMRPSYDYLRRGLQLLQRHYPGARWNLKHPLDLFYLTEIQAVFPDARVIWTHRDPAKALPSAVSLIAAFREPFVPAVDLPRLARFELDQRVEMVRRGMAYRARADALHIVDLYNDDLIQNAPATIRQAYEQLGIAYTDAFDVALLHRNTDRPKGKFGAHHYSAADFGLDETDIARRFAFYTGPLFAGRAVQPATIKA